VLALNWCLKGRVKAMGSGKAFKLWIVNVFSFILFAILAVTGLMNWMVLPKGYQGGGGFLVSFRHFFRQVHEWTALLFIIVVLVHIFFHWSYIQSNLKKYGMIK
jgi:hypothetical protein